MGDKTRVLKISLTVAIVAMLLGCGGFFRGGGAKKRTSTQTGEPQSSLIDARKGFQTKIVRTVGQRDPLDQPPPKLFSVVKYPTAVGELPAYLTPDPKDNQKHPAIIWITGGDCNTIGDVWSNSDPKNDQTASQYRQAGIVMMFPSLRGGNQNPGKIESFFGEVDDVIAAHDYLSKQPYIDPNRIYLGGHSTGGTLVLLTSICSNKFRAVFSFGPVDDVGGYGPEYVACDLNNHKEIELRSPIHWLDNISSPTFVMEGRSQGNLDSLQTMETATKNPKVKFLPVPRHTHFSLLGPCNKFIAQKILADTGPTCNLAITEGDVKFAK